MQGPIAQALMLTCAGNAFLAGRDVSGFWPDALVFKFSKSCDFRVVEGDDDQLVAPDPFAWFDTLRGARGLRLHHAPRPRGPDQALAVEERMLAGFVGGGPAWLIEVVGEGRSAIWQGFDRLGDRNDPERKIWRHTYLQVGETEPQEFAAQPLAEARADLDRALFEVEAIAGRMQWENWRQVFAAARGALSTPPPDHFFRADFERYAGFDDVQQGMVAAASGASVFGGMGSWNDVAPSADLQARPHVRAALCSAQQRHRRARELDLPVRLFADV